MSKYYYSIVYGHYFIVIINQAFYIAVFIILQNSLFIKPDIEPIPGQEGGRRKHPSCTCFVCNVSKEPLSDAGLGDSHKPKKYTSYWCSICKHALCIDPCFRLYHTEKDYTSEVIKIARHSVKPIQKDVQHV